MRVELPTLPLRKLFLIELEDFPFFFFSDTTKKVRKKKQSKEDSSETRLSASCRESPRFFKTTENEQGQTLLEKQRGQTEQKENHKKKEHYPQLQEA